MRAAVFASLVMSLGCAGTVRGVVFVDHNGDGVRQHTEHGLANVVVALDRHVFTRTGDDGAYFFAAATPAAHVWARVPAGYRPGAVFGRVTVESVDLPLTPLTARELAAPLRFVVAADAHATVSTGLWDGGDLEDAIGQAVAQAEPPRFFTIVGDVTQNGRDAEFTRVEQALRGLDVPWVPVPGNHDWFDGGAAWRARWGPDNYSFDSGELHVVVWDTNLTPEDQLAFLEADLASVDPDAIVVALGHDSPLDAVGERMAELGVDYLFTGHWHSNRRVERRGMIEWGTQTMVMGTIDQSPAGYRVVTFVDGVPEIEHRARLIEPHLALTSPHPGSCASPSGGALLAAVALDGAVPIVRARIDCGPEIELVAGGGWSYGAALPALAPGTHGVELVAESPGGRRVTRRVGIEVCEPDAVALEGGSWPQVAGGPLHTNASARAIAPPLAQRWATAVGGNVLLGSPVVADGIVVIAIWDLGAGDRGGVVALDLATGAVRWRHVTPLQARAAPAITGDLVVIALATGELQAVALADGSMRWTHDAAHGLDSHTSSLWGSPTVANGLVYVAVQGRMSAIDAADGHVVWERDAAAAAYPWLGSLAAVTVAGDLAFATSGRHDGITAWQGASGGRWWKLASDRTTAINATPVATEDGTLFVSNAAGVTTALDSATGAIRWSIALTADSDDWTYAITATPAFANGRLFVPTQHRDLIAVDAATGDELWRATTGGGPLNFAHYRAAQAGFAASPVVTGEILWVPRPDGVLAALATADGHELWSTQLGAPVVSAPTPAGDYLIVATFDGTVRALAPTAVARAVPPPQACAAIDPPGVLPPAGCCAGARTPPALPVAVVMVAWLRRRRRRAVTASAGPGRADRARRR
jgi:outer membrane protein assembly factor BamB